MGPDLHVGDLEGDRLEAGDRLAERLALAGVPGALVDAALAQAGGQGGHGDAAVLEGAEEVGQAAAALAEGVGHRHPAALEDQLAGVGGASRPWRRCGRPGSRGYRRAR